MILSEERERAFERVFAHDEETGFLAQARRNALFGRWAAEHLGLSGEEADRYARPFSDAVIEPGCERYLIEKVRDDHTAHGLPITEDALRRAWEGATIMAISQEVRAHAHEAPVPDARG